MFCGKCGTKNEEGIKFCGGCGSAIASQHPTVEKEASAPVSAIGQVAVGPITITAITKESGRIAIGSKVFTTAFFFKCMSLLLAVLFFMPMFSVRIRMFGFSAGGRLSGWNAAFGSEGASGSFVAIFLLLIPVALFALFQFKAQLDGKIEFVRGKRFSLAIWAFALGFAFLFITRSSLNSTFGGHVGVAFGFVLSVILYLLLGFVAICGYMAASGKHTLVKAPSLPIRPTAGSGASQARRPNMPLPTGVKAIFISISALLLVGFFLNFATMRFDDGGVFSALGAMAGVDLDLDIAMSGLDMFLGFDDGWGREDGRAVFALLLIVPVVSALLIVLQKHLRLRTQGMLVLYLLVKLIGIGVLGFALMLILEDEFSMGVGVILSIVLYVVGIVLAGLYIAKPARGTVGASALKE